ncbi:hypothetical protein [Bacillus suaedaesalsae]|uniref:YolD-like family protein n=1 Tax=Bacillus suaedaesalsae TaxID=2810349 RepID=A0ABS2DCV0_9BACI|nr:hypothetical protein [Bacillus suaedaesalsae]MBM6616291.1 hypothetical protein [Bacillus suaedaesalsae]
MEKLMMEIQQWEKEKCLLHIKVVLKKKGRHILVGRIVNFNQNDMSLLVYLDDAKIVEHYNFSEIDDIVPAR